MFPDEIVFELVERRNVHRVSAKEWALNIRFDGGENWTVESWQQEPSEETIDRTKYELLSEFLRLYAET